MAVCVSLSSALHWSVESFCHLKRRWSASGENSTPGITSPLVSAAGTIPVSLTTISRHAATMSNEGDFLSLLHFTFVWSSGTTKRKRSMKPFALRFPAASSPSTLGWIVPMTQRNGLGMNTPLWLLLRSDMATLWLNHRHPELRFGAVVVAVEVLEPPGKLVGIEAQPPRIFREDAVDRLRRDILHCEPDAPRFGRVGVVAVCDSLFSAAAPMPQGSVS